MQAFHVSRNDVPIRLLFNSLSKDLLSTRILVYLYVDNIVFCFPRDVMLKQRGFWSWPRPASHNSQFSFYHPCRRSYIYIGLSPTTAASDNKKDFSFLLDRPSQQEQSVALSCLTPFLSTFSHRLTVRI